MGGRVCLKPVPARSPKNLTSMFVEPASEIMSLSLQLCLLPYKKDNLELSEFDFLCFYSEFKL